MGFKKYLVFLSALAVLLRSSNGCQMTDLEDWGWLVSQQVSIQDVFSGEFVSRETSEITGIHETVYAEGLHGGPYFNVEHSGSQFSISTADAFEHYEEYETLTEISLTVTFNCVGGHTRGLVFSVTIEDTNNNAPEFRPTNEYEFMVMPPLPPGYTITGCLNDIIVRDIDLTTQKIDFGIYNSPYFEIAYDEAASIPGTKEFRAALKTTTFIRTIPETIEFTISATDVDLTPNASITTYATVKVISDDQFKIPEEMVFSRTFYMATYTDQHKVVLEDTITLRQGFHQDVKFSLGPEYLQYFEVSGTGNEVLIEVRSHLPDNLLEQQHILLVVKAEREHTSGASATVILQLPQEEALKFQLPSYEGTIVDNVLNLPVLTLSQGYEGNTVTVGIVSEHASYFSYTVQQNSITLAMSPLPTNVLQQNNFLNLQVTATTGRTSASTIVTLDIVQDDGVTPVFERSLYEGTYNPADGLELEQIILVQGYDNTVEISLQGDHKQYFQLNRNGMITTITASTLPTELFREPNLLLTIVATKPRTVGASAVISIALPAETQLEFAEQYYKGVIEENVLRLDQLTLSKGFENDPVSVHIQSGSAHSSYFSAVITSGVITISMSPLPANIILENTFLNLQVVASTDRSSASAVVTLEVIKNDKTTPVFERSLYEGSYDPVNGLALDDIVLTQGYDGTVTVTLQGVHSTLFGVVREGQVTRLTVSSIPQELFSEQNLLFTIHANKPRTVGSSATISIALPAETQLEFTEQYYKGIIEENVLRLHQLTLSQGFENNPVSVHIQSGSAHSSYFSAGITGGLITVSMSPLPANIILENTFLNLQVVASTDRSTASAVVTLEVIKNDKITPVFERTLYEGSYDPVNGLTLDDIVLAQGYDATVIVSLQGDHSTLFGVVREGQVTRLTVSSIPQELFSEQNLLLTIQATRPRTVGGHATISITLPADRKLGFASPSYSGSIQNGQLALETIVLNTGFTADVEFSLSGDYSSYFDLNENQNEIQLELRNQLPESVILNNNFLLLTLSASALNAVTTSTTILLEIVTSDTTTPRFNQNIFYGACLEPTSVDIASIYLTQGFDSTVTFRLEGVHSQYFQIDNDGSNVALTLKSRVPDEVVFDYKVLTFSILAEKPLTVGAAATIAIRFPPELTEPIPLRFSQNVYTGSFENDVFTLEDIILQDGHAPGTQVGYSLVGEFSSHFTLNPTSDGVTVAWIGSPIPGLLERQFFKLELIATRVRAVDVTTVILIDVIHPEDVVRPVFDEAYYRGVYTEKTGLQFEEKITLYKGFDDTVSFVLDGAFSQYFDIEENGNSLSIISRSALPEGVLENNNHLLFAIVAEKPGVTDGRAAILIDLPKEIQLPLVLSFTQASFVGQIEDGSLTLPPVALTGGHNLALKLSLTGEFASHFSVEQESNIVNVKHTALPSEVIDDNAFIVLDLVASYPTAVSGYTSIVFELVKKQEIQIVPPMFEQAYYIGQYSMESGLVFEHTIQLAQGFDESVSFTLAGDGSESFSLVPMGENGFSLSVNNEMIDNIQDRRKLVFSVVAARANVFPASAAIVIALTDFVQNQSPRFAEDYYTGTIDDGRLSLAAIVLEKGHSPDMEYALTGDFVNYFQLTQQNGIFVLQLPYPLPAEITQQNNVIILTLAVTVESMRTHTTIILKLKQEVDHIVPEIRFENPYYVGSYSQETGLMFKDIIRIDQEYEGLVLFDLEGENAQWFAITQEENSVRLRLDGTIPPAVVANNHQLLFVVSAKRPGGSIARATIIILLNDEVTSDQLLGFDRNSYVGSIVDNTAKLSPITLSEGFTPDVTFTLHGGLASYFILNVEGPTVTLALQNPIPQESLPANRLILLEIQASAPSAVSAFATVVLEVIQDNEETATLPDPVFAETFYVGSYTSAGGLVFDSSIALTEGYDENVVFGLEGDNSQWFNIIRAENSVRLILANAIPPAVVANNQQLLFIISAQRPGGSIARSTIVILLNDEVTSDQLLGFDRNSYVGSIMDNTAKLSPITLSEGFTPDVTFTLHGGLASYFILNVEGPTVTLALQNPIPQESLPANRLILLEIQASAPSAVSAFATVVLEVIQDNEETATLPDPVFAETFYVGSYTSAGGLVFDSSITLTEGYDENVVFGLEGDNSQWFSIIQAENSVRLILANAIPPAVVANNQQLLFIISAQRPGGSIARSTIVILLNDEVTSDQILGFDRNSYVGSIVDNTAKLSPITLSEGFTPDVTFTLHGGLASYFILNVEGPTVTLALHNPIPQESLPANRLILLEIQASAPSAVSAFATVVLEVIQDNEETATLPDPVFAETFYVGSYTSAGGLVFDSSIALTEGYDENVVFGLEGDNSQWFNIIRTENSVRLILFNAIPPAVVANNQQLLFIISAQRPGGFIARATIVILLNDEVTSDQLLGFDRNSYVGSIMDNTAKLSPITLSEGFTPDVTFTLHGGLASYFILNVEGPTVTLALQNPIPQESLPANRLLLLEIQASAPSAVSAFATVVLEVIQDNEETATLPDPVFAETFYVGSYTSAGGLVFDFSIALTEGYDENVVFGLEGDNSQWFNIIRAENSVRLILANPIPPAVVANNQQLLFIISAQRPGGSIARATIVILLNDEVTSDQILGFDRNSYVGSIVDNTAKLSPITLSEGFTPDVTFTLHGGLASYFILNVEGPTVTLALHNPIPQESLPANRLILLEIQASAPSAVSAFATVVLEVIQDNEETATLPDPVFAETFYVGSYTSAGGLVFDSSIALTEGYDENVVFGLEGDNSQWFNIIRTENSVRLILANPIPPAVVANNQQLLFIISAQRPGGSIARATMVILLNDEVTSDQLLGFDRNSYVGSIVDNTAKLSPITLSEGFTPDVTFTLHGGLASYFILNVEGPTVTLALQNPIPQESLPANRLILLEIQASAPSAVSAFATVVLEVIQDNEETATLPDPVFAETFYVGSYTSAGGLVFDSSIALTEGYDENVVFGLEGDNSQWFNIIRAENSVRLILANAIPPAVVANNQQLLFIISAQRPGGSIARSTIVILLNDEVTSDQLLGFDRNSYVGSIVDNAAKLSPITLSEGFTPDVTFTLYGGLASYFILNVEGPTVTLALQNPIPQESLPANRLILLEIQASAPSAVSAFATVVLEVIQDNEETATLPDPVFAETFYVGSYTSAGGLVFDSSIALTEGYDENVVFGLEGDNSQWFNIIRTENSVRLILANPIPPAVVANNQQLLFIISAQRPGGSIARATMVILLNDEVTSDQLLGFDRNSYVGSIVDNTAKLSPITLSEGFTPDVTFTLHGGLASYFILNVEGPTVTLALQNPIPQESLPANRLILLEIQASAPSAVSAFATVVLEVIQDNEETATLPDPVFAETFYVGSYTSAGGLVFDSSIALTEGYDENVVFGLEGDNSQWFNIIRAENSVRLILANAIPPAVVANNQQLLFIISAQRPGGSIARSTIVILLNDEVTSDQLLGFDRNSYVGSIVDNTAKLSPITLSEGFTPDVTFTLYGGLASYFILNVEGPTVTLALQNPIPQESLTANRLILLEIQASAPSAVSAFATVVLEVIQDSEETATLPDPVFAETFYVGSYTSAGGLVFDSSITLSDGYDENVLFALEGDNSQWFGVIRNENSVRLRLDNTIPPAVVANNQQLLFVISAQRPGGSISRATIVILLNDEVTSDQLLGFDRNSYVGSIVDNTAKLSLITLSEGFTPDVTFTLHGGLASYFILNVEGPTVTLALQTPIPQESLPANRLILLEIQATAPEAVPAFATVVLKVVLDDETISPNNDVLSFDEIYYVGNYSPEGGLTFDAPIVLTKGFDENVEFRLSGEHSQWFYFDVYEQSLLLKLVGPIPPAVIADHLKLVFVVTAERPGSHPARATVIIILEQDGENDLVAFDKVLYGGIIQGGVVQHGVINLNGYDGNINIVGEFSTLFSSSRSGASVLVQAVGPLTLPADLRHVVLELRAQTAGSVLILDVSATEEPALPTVSFESTSYAIRVEIGQTGLVGRVGASSDNGEAVRYSLLVDNEHLRTRISIDSNGDLLLSAPANSGAYTFQVVATTVFTEATASAQVHLAVEAVTVCGDDTIVTAPLIILNRDEEEPHRDLVILGEEHKDCSYKLIRRWPADQDWLYVDETGLHARSIDREDPSIAFMTVSQVQVELILECEDNVTRKKRSADERLNWLGPYAYGTNAWILADTIQFNPRRTIVNLIVNDINDNPPILIGKDTEPMIVGYPIPELEETVLPRSLAELQATDADIGVNAALVYWSSEPALAVSPNTGFVHVRNEQQLVNDQVLTVGVTDLNGLGNNGSITLRVKLLDSSHIAVITVRDAFLEDEGHILRNISNVIGYEVRSLRSVVISETVEEPATRTSRVQRAGSETGASLEVYVYGLAQSEPVHVDTIANDINSAAIITVNIASILSLEDHLEGLQICVIQQPGHDTGLLVATIVLSVLLFILIVAIIIWLILTRMKRKNYNEFSDANSLASRNESPVNIEPVKTETLVVPVTKPRLNIEELKRSEQRLQDMLNAPIEEVMVEPNTSSNVSVFDYAPAPNILFPDPIAPIVIQDKLKDAEDESDSDEFGEIKKSPRKSVVTFNENVEKIIHVDETPDRQSPDFEICKL